MKTYKELRVTCYKTKDKKDGTLVKFRFKADARDEDIIKFLDDLKLIMSECTIEVDIHLIKEDVLNTENNIPDKPDEKPPIPTDPIKPPPEKEEHKFLLKAKEFKLYIPELNLNDEDIYGPKLDGLNPTYTLYFVDKEGKEHKIPRNGIDEFKAENETGAIEYDSIGKFFRFSLFIYEDTNYILRRN